MIRPRIAIIGALASAVLALAAVSGVAADATYHTARIPLQPIGTETGTGFVLNAHANGPQVFAQENYVLIGAQPNAAYQVTLLLYVGDPTCSSTPVTMPTEIVATNAAGNGQSKHVFLAADVPQALHGATVGAQWQVSLGTEVAFETSCSSVALD